MTHSPAKRPNQPYVKVHLPSSLKEQLQTAATERNVSVSSLLRIIVTEYIRQKG